MHETRGLRHRARSVQRSERFLHFNHSDTRCVVIADANTEEGRGMCNFHDWAFVSIQVICLVLSSNSLLNTERPARALLLV